MGRHAIASLRLHNCKASHYEKKTRSLRKKPCTDGRAGYYCEVKASNPGIPSLERSQTATTTSASSLTSKSTRRHDLAGAIFVRRNAWPGKIDRSSGENEVERTTIAFNGSVCGTGITKNVLGPHTASGGNMGDVWKAWGS